MAQGNRIVVTGQPKGVFLEGIINAELYPGIVMMITNVAPIAGRFTWGAYDVNADGDQRIIAVLREDELQGRSMEDHYHEDDRCFLYCPAMGEDLNMLVLDVAGTGTTGSEAKVIGDILMVDDGTGTLVDTAGTPEAEPFVLLEPHTEPIFGNTLLWCKFTGY